MSSLMNAPAFNPAKEKQNRNILIAIAASIVLLIVLTFVGYVTGHGWLFSNYPSQRKVDKFLNAIEAKDYAKAYGIYNNDADWASHADKYKDYPLARFTEDWTTHSPIEAPITSHHVDASATDGSGTFGTGVIVAVNVNDKKEIFMYALRSDGTLTWPAPHELTRY
ncbi:hypothetical protein SAMN05421819_2872 [Bryocella elongata]|uniref:Uncharacterized protein n=1 Tax=Bryocella elongata TaxID=863522 RepID=A0A1H6A2T2_9BACT|nr:hypothetical protein [Bryocella elongata]SEG42680.1 hypothetical protein SAMN05421819_2872 [Bryocella elongata]